MFLKSLGVLGGRASLAVAPVRAPASDGRWEFSAHEASPNSTGDGIGWDGMGWDGIGRLLPTIVKIFSSRRIGWDCFLVIGFILYLLKY